MRHDAFACNYSRERLFACWSIIIAVAVLLLTPSKMSLVLASAGAWSVSAAIGVEWLARRIVLGLDGFAVPMPPQYEPAAWENFMIISSVMT